jgi:hypothetical protein
MSQPDATSARAGSNDRLTVVMAGMIAGDPYQGGATWAILQYLLGLRRLGHEVYFVEPVNREALQPDGASLLHSKNATYFRQVMNEFDLTDRSCLLLTGTHRTFGISYEAMESLARRADVLINVAGMLTDELLTEPIPTRVYLDLDPAFIQLWHAVEGIDMHFAGHTHFVTVGLALGQPGCSAPTCGMTWITTLQPVVLERWPVATRIVHDALTTVGNWRGYGSVQRDGVLYGQKAHSIRQFMSLPTRTRQKIALALAIHPEERSDLELLFRNGWCLIDPTTVASTPDSYQAFIQGSKAELGIAKSGYVLSQCGWFSDRSVCYLASGRPVIAQNTGFSRFLPVGEGLFAFQSEKDLLECIDNMNGAYARHARAARELAESHFDSDLVLARLLRALGATA